MRGVAPRSLHTTVEKGDRQKDELHTHERNTCLPIREMEVVHNTCSVVGIWMGKDESDRKGRKGKAAYAFVSWTLQGLPSPSL
jgi:hypothetical protein